MRSLFNGPTVCKAGSCVTAYGGVDRDHSDYDKHNAHALSASHARASLQAPGGTQDGRPLSGLFVTCDDSFIDQQLELDVTERTPLTVRLRGVSVAVRNFANNTGVGYFANTSLDKSRHNVRVDTVVFKVDKVDHTEEVLFAKRDIGPFEEILCLYKNKDGSIV